MINELVTVIVPIYNQKKYLSMCLDSIINQTYKNIEILLIDDGSTDGSSEICDQYALIDERICVYHIESQGVSNAGNFALKNRSGDWICFVDSDDYIESTYVSDLINATNGDRKCISFCLANNFFEDGTVNRTEINIDGSIRLPVSKFNYRSLYAHYVVWGCMFNSNIIKDVSFSKELFVGEDTLFFAEALKKSEYFVFVNKHLYNYRQSSSGETLSKGEYNYRRHTELLAWQCVCELFNDQNILFKLRCRASLTTRCVGNYIRISKNKSAKKDFGKEIIKLIRKNILSVVVMNPKEAVRTILCAWFPKLFLVLFNIKHRRK